MRSKFIRLYIKSIVAFLLTLTISLSSFAQNLLQRRISLSAKNKPIKEVLSELESKAGVYFSYNSDLLEEGKKVSCNAEGQPLEVILNDILGVGYRYQTSDNHIIIKLASGQGIVFSGRLVEAETGQPIEYASIYEKSLMAGATTDINGNFKLHIRQPLPKYELVITKLSYEDTVLRLEQNYSSSEPIALKRSIAELDGVTVYGVEQHWLAKRLISTKDKFNAINLKGYFSKQPYQFSLIPGLGSKNRIKSQSINKFSFNLIGGYTAGVRGFELGTGFNIVQSDMEYVQIGGVFNIVGGHTRGVQIAGAYNYVNQSASGVQVAGIYNNADSVRGVQAAGAVNWVRGHASGVQAAGVINKSKRTNGAQFAGFANWNDVAMTGFQAAGAINKNENLKGVQAAGLMNFTADQTDGAQIAGGINYTKTTINGTQIAGLVNYAKKVNGTQIGLINIADSSSGLSLGLISIILKGKHSLDLNVTDWQPYSLSYKSGNDRLYNIFQIGGNPHSNKKQLSFGYGIGGTLKLSKKSDLVQEIVLHTVYAGNWNDQNLLGRYQLLFQYRLHPSVKIYAGPAFNLLYHERKEAYEGYSVLFLTNYPSFEVGNNIKAWLGWTVGFALF